jgi:hypothetical protein
MTFSGKLAGYPVCVAADNSQASHCFISEQWVQRAGVHVTPLAGQVTLASSGDVAHVIGMCSLRMQIGSLHDVVECFALKMSTRHDLILGDAYLKARQAVLCYATSMMIVHQ